MEGATPDGEGELVNFGVHHLPLPGGAPAPKKPGVAPSTFSPPVRRRRRAVRVGHTQAGTLLRFTVEDTGNPRQPVSNADSRAQL